MSTHWQCLHPLYTSDASNISADPDTIATPDNRGWAYGDGFFTTMGVMDGQVLWQNQHQTRLVTHARALQLILPIDSIMTQVQAAARSLGEGVLKLVVTRMPQALRGYGFSHDTAGHACSAWLKSTAMTLSTQTMTLPDGRPVLMQPAIDAVCLNSQIACLPPPLAGLKSLNRLDNVLASGELQALREDDHNNDKNIGEGLVRDMSGRWIEGTMSNVFYQLTPATNVNLNQGQWFTPPMSQSGVVGVMRGVIIEALAGSSNPVIERSVTDDDLPNIGAMFFCNAVRGITPVRRLFLRNGEAVGLLI